jgi:hypothetical protein
MILQLSVRRDFSCWVRINQELIFKPVSGISARDVICDQRLKGDYGSGIDPREASCFAICAVSI